MKKVGKINLKTYAIVNGIAILFGIIIWGISLDKSRRLFLLYQ